MHTNTQELRQKKQSNKEWDITCRHSESVWREYQNTLHYPIVLLSMKKIQESRSQLEMSCPPQTNHPLHHTTTPGSLGKQGQKSYYRQFSKCESPGMMPGCHCKAARFYWNWGISTAFHPLNVNDLILWSEVKRNFHFQWCSQLRDSCHGHRSLRTAV